MKKKTSRMLLGILFLLFLTAIPIPTFAAKKNGLVQENGSIYFYKKGKMIHDKWKTVDGKKYYFGENGKAYKKYKKVNDTWYYFNEEGALQYKTLLKGKNLYRINPLTGEVLKVIKKNTKMICLTFDDGPWTASTDSVIRTLKANNVGGTFFIVGRNATVYGNKLKSEYALGCDIANHTYSHLVANGYTSSAVFAGEIRRCNEILAKYGIPAAKYLRAPGGGIHSNGRYNAATQAAAKQMGMPVFYWSKQSNDCAGASVGSIIANCTSSLSDGHIVLMHDSYSTTAQALPSILRILKQRGYEPVSLSEFALCRGITYHAGSLYYRYDASRKKMLKYTPTASRFYWGIDE